MHVVLGDGVMPTKELHAHLQDLWDKDEENKQNFWFLIQTKAEPSSTDTAIQKWMHDNQIWYEVIGDGSEVADIYDQAQESYKVKRLAPKVVSLMQTRPDEGETAHILALFASDDPDAQQDRWLNDVISEAADAGFKTFALNDGMVEIDLEDADDGEMEAEELEDEEAVPEDPRRSPQRRRQPRLLPHSLILRKGTSPMPFTPGTSWRTSTSLPSRKSQPRPVSHCRHELGSATYIDAILGEREEEPSGRGRDHRR